MLISAPTIPSSRGLASETPPLLPDSSSVGSAADRSSAASSTRVAKPGEVDLAVTSLYSPDARQETDKLAPASTILNFVRNQLTRDLESGASIDALLARIDAARTGFIEGYDAALEELQGGVGMNEAVLSELNETRISVLSELAALAESLGPPPMHDEQTGVSVPSKTPVSLNPLSDLQAFASSLVSNDLNISEIVGGIQGTVTEIQARRSFSLDLKTSEGDRIQIVAASAASISENHQTHDTFSLSGISVSLEGDLSESEREEITHLLKSVDALASAFYDGDYAAAFEAALNMGFEYEEIAGFSLVLKQSVDMRVQNYLGNSVQKDITPISSENESAGALGSPFKRLAQFIKQLESLAADTQKAGVEMRELLFFAAGASVLRGQDDRSVSVFLAQSTRLGFSS